MVITVFCFSAQKGLIGPAGMPGPAGPKGERVSIYQMFVFCFYFNRNILFLMRYSAIWIVSTFKGEKGDSGLPGPTGPQGIPVSLLDKYSTKLVGFLFDVFIQAWYEPCF